ncbi:MAG: hypothetical protein H0W99_16275 [Acidobacteria bacterium]|nr:hypothetical protein [Acidobacteriota bacterium]
MQAATPIKMRLLRQPKIIDATYIDTTRGRSVSKIKWQFFAIGIAAMGIAAFLFT